MVDEQKSTIAVVSDIHVARHWDEVERIVGSRTKFLNPNRELRNLVDTLNGASDVGSVVFNGDAVDYYFSDRRENCLCGNKREDNWSLFNGIISGLDKPVLQILGNHDYRKEPYNYRIYGLKHLNVPDAVRRELSREIGHNLFTGPFEFESIAVSEALFDPLKKFQGSTLPTEIDISGVHSILLNTGSDAYVRPRNWIKYLAKSFIGNGVRSDCDGLTKQDISFVRDSISRNGDVCVFMHAPVIHPEISFPGAQYQLSERQFLRSIASQGLSDRVSLNNGGELLKTLRNSDGNSIIIASHTHDSNYFLIDKGSFTVREVDNSEFNERRNDSRYIKQVTTLPLGAVPHKGEKKTGYMTISPGGFNEVVTGFY
jgi:predicted MPP superfamily phosphohydrolase